MHPAPVLALGEGGPSCDKEKTRPTCTGGGGLVSTSSIPPPPPREFSWWGQGQGFSLCNEGMFARNAPASK